MTSNCEPFGRPFTHVVWLQTSFIGDIVLSSAAMQLAHRLWPNVAQAVITTNAGAEVLSRLPFLEQSFVFAKRHRNFLRMLQGTADEVQRWAMNLPSGSFPILLQAHKSFRSSTLAALTGLPVITYRESNLWPLLFVRKKRLIDRVMPFHEAARIAMLLEPLGANREEIIAAKPYLPSDGSRDLIGKWPMLNQENRPVIGIAPGSVWATKRWPVDRFTELAGELLRAYPACHLVLLGSGAEIELCEKIESGVLRHSDFRRRVDNLAGKTNLNDLPVIFSKLDLVISNDSSPVHFASAANVPVVAIFGATIPAFGFGPRTEGSQVVDVGRIDCRPCSDHGPQECPLGHFQCMTNLQVSDVKAAAAAIIERLPGSSFP